MADNFKVGVPITLVWPHLWRTVVLSLENAHFCQKSWCQIIIFSLDLFLLAHDMTKIGHFLENKVLAKVNLLNHGNNENCSTDPIFKIENYFQMN